MAKVCNVKGCPDIATSGGRCGKHQRIPWEGRRGFEGYKGDYLKARRQTLKEEPVCQLCGINPSITTDHIIPKSQGGSNDRTNLRALCQQCHDRRSQAQATAARRGGGL